MTTHFPSNTRALLTRSPCGADLEAFALWLAGEGYSPFVT